MLLCVPSNTQVPKTQDTLSLGTTVNLHKIQIESLTKFLMKKYSYLQQVFILPTLDMSLL